MPATVVCDRVLANKTPSNGVLFSLVLLLLVAIGSGPRRDCVQQVLICGGAVVSTVTDASFTSVGTAASVLMVSSTAMNQIVRHLPCAVSPTAEPRPASVFLQAIQEATQKLKMSSPQLLLKCLPFAEHALL